MKKCSLCKKTKLVKEFNKNSKRPDGLQTFCRECSRERSRQYYADNKEKHKQVVGEKKKVYVAECRKAVWKYLTDNSCVDCGSSDPRVLEFDHLRDKSFGISRMIADGCSWDKVKKEIEKCDVVCANCHRIRTYQRENSWRHAMHMGL